MECLRLSVQWLFSFLVRPPPAVVYRPSVIFLGFMRFGADETHEIIVGCCFYFFHRCVLVTEAWSRSRFSKGLVWQ